MERARKKRVRIDEHSVSDTVLLRAAKRAKVEKEVKEIKEEKTNIQGQNDTNTTIVQVLEGHIYYEFVDLNAEPELENGDGTTSLESEREEELILGVEELESGDGDTSLESEREEELISGVDVPMKSKVKRTTPCRKECSIPRRSFERVVREICQDKGILTRWGANALLALQEATEAFMISLFGDFFVVPCAACKTRSVFLKRTYNRRKKSNNNQKKRSRDKLI